jgi:hypothetical protein
MGDGLLSLLCQSAKHFKALQQQLAIPRRIHSSHQKTNKAEK